jgi:hypothetical protein
VEHTQHQYYDSFADELMAKFRRVDHLVNNRDATGTYHEEILRSVLKRFLSRRFSIKTGFVYAHEEAVSRQIDIIVVDENLPNAYIYQEGDFAIVNKSSAIAVIEVKTRLRCDDFDDALENIASVKRLYASPSNILGILFGYDGTKPTVNVLNKWFTRKAAAVLLSTPEHGPTLISFFQHNLLLITTDKRFQLTFEGTNIYRMLASVTSITNKKSNYKGWQLRNILALIYTSILERDSDRRALKQSEREVRDLMLYSGAVPSNDYCSLGKGYINSRNN